VELAGLPEAIRGYEAIKPESARAVRARAEALCAPEDGRPPVVR
jgi:hypothetical protein